MVKILNIGKTKEKFFVKEIEHYCDRIKKYARISYHELPDVKGGGKHTHEVLKEMEGEVFLKHVRPQDFVCILDEKGLELTSSKFAKKMESWLVNTNGDVVFIIGGAFGFGENLKERANTSLALSQMTLTHQMVRLFFVEQVYRGFTILNGEKYHHE